MLKKLFGKKESTLVKSEPENAGLMTAAYLCVIFDTPGPKNYGAELKDLIPYLEKNTSLVVSRNMQISAITQPLQNATDLIPVDTGLFVYMKEKGVVNSDAFIIRHTGLNVHTNEYKYILAAWAMETASELHCEKCGSTIQQIFSSSRGQQIMNEQITLHLSGNGSQQQYIATMKSLGGICPECAGVSCANCYGENSQKCPKCGVRIPQLAG